MSESIDIYKALWMYYANGDYLVDNVYFYSWESDFLVVKDKSAMAYEIEVKTSRSDFFADFKKTEKHEILINGFTWYNGEKRNHKRPNRFYYCVPDGLIAAEEVPAHAGLMYVKQNNWIRIIKKAPLLHKEPLTSCVGWLGHKFYTKWIQARAEAIRVREVNEVLRKEIAEIKEKPILT